MFVCQVPARVTGSVCFPRRYVIECPNCGVVYRSRQYWFGNQDPVDTVVRTEIVHVWPGVRAVLFFFLYRSVIHVCGKVELVWNSG